MAPHRRHDVGAAPARGGVAPGLAASRDWPEDTANFVTPDPMPRAAYDSFRAACDTVEALLRRGLGTYADSASFGREPVPFVYADQVRLLHTVSGRPYWSMGMRDTAVIVPALRMTLRTWTHDLDPDSILAVLDGAGWVEDIHFSADGHGGRHFGLVSREALCVFRFSWDDPGDAPEDSAYVSVPGMEIGLVCVPRPPTHPLQRSVGD